MSKYLPVQERRGRKCFARQKNHHNLKTKTIGNKVFSKIFITINFKNSEMKVKKQQCKKHCQKRPKDYGRFTL